MQEDLNILKNHTGYGERTREDKERGLAQGGGSPLEGNYNNQEKK